MVIGLGLFNLFNLLYHFFMVRSLLPIEYGHLNTLMALFMVISVPASTVQTTITKFVSSFYAEKRYKRVKDLLKHFFLFTSSVGAVIFLLILLSNKTLAEFLQISPHGLVILLGAILFFGMVIPVPWGGLQGLQKFGSLTFNLIINGAFKFFIGVLLIVLGLGVLGALGAIFLSYVITTLVSLLMLWINIPKRGLLVKTDEIVKSSNPSYFSEIYHYFFPAGMTLLCFMLLTNIDLILVKHFFKPIEAGYYSIAQMVGKIILFLPIPLVMVMFPKLTNLGEQKDKGLTILTRSLRIAIFFCVITILVVFLFPTLIIRILTGKVYPECIPLVRFFSINMTLFSLILILLYYHLSKHKRGFLYPLFSLTVIQTVSILFFHKTLTQVLFAVGLVALCLLIVNFYLIYRPERN